MISRVIQIVRLCYAILALSTISRLSCCCAASGKLMSVAHWSVISCYPCALPCVTDFLSLTILSLHPLAVCGSGLTISLLCCPLPFSASVCVSYIRNIIRRTLIPTRSTCSVIYYSATRDILQFYKYLSTTIFVNLEPLNPTFELIRIMQNLVI